MNEDFLEHFGVKGMKWGVRKEESSSNRKLSLKDPKVKRAVVAGVLVTGIIAGAFIASHYNTKVSAIPTDVLKKGSEKVSALLDVPTDIIYMSKAHQGAGVTRNGVEKTTLNFISKGGTKDFFGIFDKAGLNGTEFDNNTFRKMSNGDVAAIIADLSGRVDAAGRAIPHAVLIPASKASGLNNLQDVIREYGPELESRYQSYLSEARKNST